MMKKFSASLRRLTALLLAALLLLTLLPALSLAEEENVIQLTGRYTSSATSVIREVSFPFSDSDFLRDDSIYNHRLAQASLGMALSAFRDWKLPMGHHEDHVVDYLHDAGFSDLVHAQYNEIPTQDTIATVIGSKRIGDETVIAVAVCGGGYKNEWKSNFDVGHEETRHQGFNHASQLVQQRIRDYLEDYGISGKVCLWISGYSRAGATTNITAADMTDSGLFENVYAYCFAPPRTTRDSGSYDNIFNIIGPTDPVPQVPLADWGYNRYGVDLYTPAQEYDSDWGTKSEKADDVAEEITGSYFRNNPIQNFRLHTILSYLLSAFPTSSSYQDTLEPKLVEMWGGDIDQMLTVLEKALKEIEDAPAEQQQELSSLLSYVEEVLFDQLRNQDEMAEKKLWDKDVAMADNIIHEHNPDVYVEWMLSAESGEELFFEPKESYRVVVYGNVELYVYDQVGFVECILPDGTVTTNAEALGIEGRDAEDIPDIYGDADNGRSMVILPADRIYALGIYSETDQDVSYVASVQKVNTLKTSAYPTQEIKIKANETYVLITAEDTFATLGDNSELTKLSVVGMDDPTLLIQLESLNIFKLSLSTLVGVIVLVFVLLIAFVFIQLVLTIIRKIRKVHRKAWASITSYGLLCVFFYILAELSRYHLNAITTIYIVLKTISVFWAVLLAFKGTLYNPSRFHWLVFAALFCCLPGDASSSQTLSALFLGLMHVILIVAIVLEKKPSIGQIISALIMWAAAVVLILVNRTAFGNKLWICIAYSLLIFALPAMAAGAPAQLMTGCLFLATADILVGLSWVMKTAFAYRAVAVAIYLSGVFIMAASNWAGKKPDKLRM